MQRKLLAVIAPPLAVCRYGCAGRCAAPIGLFWVGAIGSIIYGFAGGPTGAETISWVTVALGLVLWALAAIWAEDTIKGVTEDMAHMKKSSWCRKVPPREDESDPLDEVRKAGSR